jgi:2'-5' RNA ligase
MPRRVVVTFPRIESAVEWEQLLSVRERLDPLAGKIAPHLTLVFPFDDPMSDRALEQQLRNVVTDLPPFPITLCEITAHEGEYLFLNVKRGNDALVQLHDSLYTGALAAHRSRLHTFVPHLTVGRLAPADLPAALDATADLTSAIQANVDNISVYRIEPDGTRPVLFELPLPSVAAPLALV